MVDFAKEFENYSSSDSRTNEADSGLSLSTGEVERFLKSEIDDVSAENSDSSEDVSSRNVLHITTDTIEEPVEAHDISFPLVFQSDEWQTPGSEVELPLSVARNKRKKSVNDGSKNKKMKSKATPKRPIRRSNLR